MENHIYDLYADYIHAVDTYYESQKTGDILGSMLSGRGRYSGCSLHEPFLKELEQAITELACSTPSSEFTEELLQFILLTDHVTPEHPARLPLDTAEGLVLPLFPFLSTAQLQELCARYRHKLRKRPGLPCQRAVLKALKSRQ